jgi:hypothetical protein
LELIHGVLELLPLLRREVFDVDIHDIAISGILVFGCCPTRRAKKCVDAKCAPSAKHTASRTSWLHTRKESRDVPVNFPWKLTKEKVVKYQSLELAGWYQIVPYLWLRSQMGWHIAIKSYLPINWNHSGALKRKK